MKMSENARKMTLAICIAAFIIIAAEVIIGIVFTPLAPPLQFAAGVILTAGINVLKVRMLDRAVAKTVDMEDGRAANYIRLQYLVRYFLTGAVLVVAALTPFINLPGAALGVLTWPAAAYALKFFMKKG